MTEENTPEKDVLRRISERIDEISGGDRSTVIYLNGVSYNESARPVHGSPVIAVSCIFVDEDERICADMYRTGNGGFYEFICGKVINDMPVKGLAEIVYALENAKWNIGGQVRAHKKIRRKNVRTQSRIPFHLKGA